MGEGSGAAHDDLAVSLVLLEPGERLQICHQAHGPPEDDAGETRREPHAKSAKNQQKTSVIF